MISHGVFLKKYKELNAKQREAVEAIYGPVMVVAGPGTGKTTVLTLRIANILAKTDAKPEEILALTFTDNAAKNMREKLREIIGDASFRVNIFTFHSFANHMKGLYSENFKKIGDRMPVGEADKMEILEQILEQHSFKELRVSQYGINLNKISGRISDLKREIISPTNLQKLIKREEANVDKKEKERKSKYFAKIKEFAKAYEFYENELRKRKLYDFDDSILGLIDALKKNRDMASEMRESFQFVLADEHQDANGAQNEILKMFRAEGVEKPNVFVVGDDKQSIFRFQGASLEHFYDFAKEFPGAKKITLTENYRSHQIILDASHSLISRDGRAHQKLSPNVRYAEKKIEITEYPDYEAELLAMAKKVKEILDERGGRETIAIIARNNKALFDIAPYLEMHRTEFAIAGERSLFDDFHYHRLMLLLMALANPFDGALQKALLAGYFEIDIGEVLEVASRAKKERRDFSAIFLEEARGEKVKELITKAGRTGVLEFLKSLKGEIQGDFAGYGALRAVFDEARKLVKKNRAATVNDLVKHLKFLEKHNLALIDNEGGKEAGVELLSIHKAKGLEFDHVFIIDATAKKFEGSGRRADPLRIPGVGSDTELDEERRLLYVALTRAKRHASVSYALAGDRGEQWAPSIILSEIRHSLVERKIHKGKEAKPDPLSPPTTPPAKDKQALRLAFRKRNFSVSALNNFLECPWKYFFRNLLLVPEPPEFAAMLGTACHSALKDFHMSAKKGKALRGKALKKLVKQAVSAEAFSASELPVALERAEKSILAYASAFRPFEKREKISVEDSRSFVYAVKGKREDFEITLTGKIDLSREKDGKIHVIDFKTKKRMTRNAIQGQTKAGGGEEWRQLQFYKFLIEGSEKGKTVSSGALTFLSPERGKILSETFELASEDAAKIEKTLKDALLSIYRFDFWGKNCGEKDCEYCKMSKMLRLQI